MAPLPSDVYDCVVLDSAFYRADGRIFLVNFVLLSFLLPRPVNATRLFIRSHFHTHLINLCSGFPLQSNYLLIMETGQTPREEVFMTGQSTTDYQAVSNDGSLKKDQWLDGDVLDGRLYCFPDQSLNILVW